MAYAIARASTGTGQPSFWRRTAAGAWAQIPTQIGRCSTRSPPTPRRLGCRSPRGRRQAPARCYYTANATGATPTWTRSSRRGQRSLRRPDARPGQLDRCRRQRDDRALHRHRRRGNDRGGASTISAPPNVSITAPAASSRCRSREPSPVPRVMPASACQGRAAHQRTRATSTGTAQAGSTRSSGFSRPGPTSWSYPSAPDRQPHRPRHHRSGDRRNEPGDAATVDLDGLRRRRYSAGHRQRREGDLHHRRRHHTPDTGDNVGGSGVASMWYRLGESGASHPGTSVPVPTTVGSYTLYFYSIDTAGNTRSTRASRSTSLLPSPSAPQRESAGLPV